MIPLLYEIIAFSIYPEYFLNRIFCLIGSGSNGKSKYLEILRKFVGNGNTTTSELDLLTTGRFESAKLYKKLVCLIGETNFKQNGNTSVLKRLTGGDPCNYEFKNKLPFTDINYAKIIIATNSIPITYDKTEGFYRRWMIIDFPNKFAERKDILSTIPDKEFENLTLKSINILKRLLKEREFTEEGTIESRKEKYENASNPFNLFISEYCIEDKKYEIPLFELFDNYVIFLDKSGKRIISKKEFKNELNNKNYNIIKKSKRFDDGSKTNWLYVKGIKLKDSSYDISKLVAMENDEKKFLEIERDTQSNLTDFNNL